jgi:hypothetical protein
MAVLIAGLSFACGLLAGLLPAHATMAGAGRLVSAFLLVVSFVTFLPGMVLAYVALWRCSLDGPLTGRGLAWLALGFSYLSLLAWYSQWAARIHPLAPLGMYVIAALVPVHLLVFAAESRAGKSVVVGLVVGGTLFAVASCWIYRSIEESRRLQTQHHLTRMGSGLQEQQERHRSPRGSPAGEVEPAAADRLPDPRSSPATTD